MPHHGHDPNRLASLGTPNAPGSQSLVEDIRSRHLDRHMDLYRSLTAPPSYSGEIEPEDSIPSTGGGGGGAGPRFQGGF